jgi:replicative DNA helicase
MTDSPLRSMPCDPDAERAVLSCGLQWADCFDKIAMNPAGSTLFYTPAHRSIWNAMADCRREGLQSDIVTVTAKLRGKDQLEQCGGPAYLAGIYTDAATPRMLPDYLKIAQEFAQRRAFIQTYSELTGDAFDLNQRISDTFQRADSAIQGMMRTTSENRTKEFRVVMAEAVHTIQERYDAGGKLPGISTGFEPIDNATNGYQGGQQWVVGARPGSGKTALAMNLAENLGRAEIPTAFFSAEMFADELGIRSLSSQAKIDSLKLARGQIGKTEFAKIGQAITRSVNWPLWVDDRPDMRLIDIQVATRNLVREHGVKIVFIDYLQLIKEPEGSRSREDAISKLSNAFKQLAKELNITTVLLAQLNRESEKRGNKMPVKSDLRDSGAIEQDANVILLLHEKSDDPTEMVVDVDVIIAKCRGGLTGPIPFEFCKPTTTFLPKFKAA